MTDDHKALVEALRHIYSTGPANEAAAAIASLSAQVERAEAAREDTASWMANRILGLDERLGVLMRENDTLRRARSDAEVQLAKAMEAVRENLPYLENLILPWGHDSVLMSEHPMPCQGHDFCLMHQAQKGADAIREALGDQGAPERSPHD